MVTAKRSKNLEERRKCFFLLCRFSSVVIIRQVWSVPCLEIYCPNLLVCSKLYIRWFRYLPVVVHTFRFSKLRLISVDERLWSTNLVHLGYIVAGLAFTNWFPRCELYCCRGLMLQPIQVLILNYVQVRTYSNTKSQALIRECEEVKCVWPCGFCLPGTKMLFKFFRIVVSGVTNGWFGIDDLGSLVGCNTDGWPLHPWGGIAVCCTWCI